MPDQETNMNGKHMLPPRKEPRATPPIGILVNGDTFQEFANSGLVKAVADIYDAQKTIQYALFVVGGYGIAIGSLATKRVYMVESQRLIALARELGIDDEPTLILGPDGEVRRG